MVTSKEAIAKTAIKLEPYLFFTGNCEEALKFYKDVFGGEITSIMRMKEMPEEQRADLPPESGDLIMHANFESPSLSFMASDARPGKHYGEGPLSLSLGMEDPKLAQQIFDALGRGGKVEMELQDMFWGDKFGMLTDRFGIDWMINCRLEQR